MKPNSENTIKIGISQYAADALGRPQDLICRKRIVKDISNIIIQYFLLSLFTFWSICNIGTPCKRKVALSLYVPFAHFL